jgi:drug/metabolite transporter (DMT)-like permease
VSRIQAARRPLDTPEATASRRRVFAIGLLLSLANIIFGAIQPVITRYGALHVDPFVFCAGSVSIAGLCVAMMLHRRGELGALIDRRYLPLLLGVSVSGTVMTTLALIYGLKRINAVAGVLLLQSEPVYSLLLATLFVGERPSLRQLGATATILTGIGLVFAGGGFSPASAAVLVFLTPLFWQSAHVLSLKVMPPLSPLCMTGARYVYSAFILTAMLFLLRPAATTQLADLNVLAVVGVTGFAIYFLGTTCWYAAISLLSLAWTTALVVPGIPLLSILFAVLFLGERATTRELIGMAIAVTGVLALVTGADPHRKLPPAEAAEAIHQPLG